MRNFGNGLKNWYGEWTINALSGIGLSVNGVSGSAALAVSGGNGSTISSASGTVLSLSTAAATNTRMLSFSGSTTGYMYLEMANTSGDLIVAVENSAGSTVLPGAPAYAGIIASTANQALSLGSNNAERVRIAGAGNVTINAPSSGTALSITNFAGSPGLSVVGAGTVPLQLQELTALPNSVLGAYVGIATAAIAPSGVNGDLVLIPRTSNVNAIGFATGNGAAAMRWVMDASGGMYASTATGGGQGIGTFNATGLYVNSGQLFFGVPASSNTTAAVSDVGKCINATGTITIPNAVFSQGHALSIYNNSASAITISASITTMRLAGTTTTGSRTLAPRGIATLWFESGTEVVVGGPGVS